jgi:hypothetical protein
MLALNTKLPSRWLIYQYSKTKVMQTELGILRACYVSCAAPPEDEQVILEACRGP